MRVQRIIVEDHLTTDCDSDPVKKKKKQFSTIRTVIQPRSLPQFVVDGLVLHDSDPRHLLEHPLPAEPLEPVDLQLGIPDVLQALRGYVDLLQKEKGRRGR